MVENNRFRKLVIHWGNHAISLTRLPGPASDHGVTRDKPTRLIETNGAGVSELIPVWASAGREIGEYLTDRDYWRTTAEWDETDSIHEQHGQLTERPPWAAELFNQLFRAIDRGDLDAARSIKAQIVQDIGDDDATLCRAELLESRIPPEARTSPESSLNHIDGPLGVIA